MIDVFIRAASLIGLPRSIGEIYGFLYCSEKPVSFEELSDGLSISRGSVSQGLKVLRQIGAVKTFYVAKSRKDHLVAELSMRRLVGGFLRDQFFPHLESGGDRLKELEALIDPSAPWADHATSQLKRLHVWHSRTQALIPLIMTALGRYDGPEESMHDLPVV